MKRTAQLILSVEGQQAFVQYAYALQQVEGLSIVTIRNYLSGLRQFMEWCEWSWREEQDERPFTPQAVAPLLLIRYRAYLQTWHRFGYRMAEVVPLHRLAQIMGHESLDTTMIYIRGTKQDLQHDVEKIAWT